MQPLDHLLADIRRSILHHSASPERLVLEVAAALDHMLSQPGLRAIGEADAGAWSGELLHECPETGFIAVLMSWGAGARTPIHDHGTWGVFGVCDGTLEFINYQRTDDEHVHPVARLMARAADISYIIPPDREIHQIHNPTDGVVHSLHIYGKNIGF